MLAKLAAAVGWTTVQLVNWMRAHPHQAEEVLTIVEEFLTGQKDKAVADLKALLGL